MAAMVWERHGIRNPDSFGAASQPVGWGKTPVRYQWRGATHNGGNMTTAFVVAWLVMLGLVLLAHRMKARASVSLAERPRRDRW